MNTKLSKILELFYILFLLMAIIVKIMEDFSKALHLEVYELWLLIDEALVLVKVRGVIFMKHYMKINGDLLNKVSF